MTQTQTNSESPQLNAGEPPTSYSSKPSNRKLPAWLLSLCLHTIIFGILLLVLANYPASGSADIENRTGGIVLVDTTSETTEYLDEGDVEEASESAAADEPPPAATVNEPAPDIAGVESSELEISDIGESLIETMPGAESLIDGSGTRIGKLGGQVTTEVFGVKGTGSRFAYVFDRSKSMNEFNRRPMLAARQALMKSLNSLTTENQFQIIFYNKFTKVFRKGEHQGLFFANEENKKSAELFINRTIPDGGTDHVKALLKAFSMSPDVIFLLTDAEGGFTRSELTMLSKGNPGTVINAIQFGQRQGRDQSLKLLAESTGGSYVFKNIETLRLKGNQ